jgi:hypothetical protein
MNVNLAVSLSPDVEERLRTESGDLPTPVRAEIASENRSDAAHER